MNNNKIRKVLLEDLPRWENGLNKNRINWEKSIGCNVKFIYDDIQDEFQIVDYDNKTSKVIIRYINVVKSMSITNIYKCRLGELLGRVTQKFKVETRQMFKDDKRDITIIDRKYIKDKNTNQDFKYYKYKCNKCGWDEGWIEESNLLKGIGCSCCANRTVVEGINDIPTTAPWMIKYFQGGYDEAKLYTRGSNKKIYPICPDCGRIKDKLMMINVIYQEHSIGCSCGDGISYPEKIVYSLLEQLKIEFKTQLSKKDFKWCSKYKYDFYFTINNEKYIIETHGIQHYEKSSRGRSLKEEQENDKIKKELALNNDIQEENYIVIDCRYSELDFIKNNILHSRLNNIFNLSKIDWLKCEEFALSNLAKKVCEIKKNNPDLNIVDISKKLKLCKETIRKYLKIGNMLGWCKYIPINTNRGKPIINLNDYKVFKSCADCERMSESIYNIKLDSSKISLVCLGIRPHHRNFKFKYVEDLTIELYIKYNIKNKLNNLLIK